MKKIITLILCMVLATVLGIFSTIALAVPTTSEDNIPSETSTTVELSANKIKRVKTSDKEKVQDLMADCKARKKAAKKMKSGAKELDQVSVVKLAEDEWNNANEDYKYYKEQYNKILEKEEKARWAKKSKEYPAATQIWQYLKAQGYNDYVCAGIMGNLMAEVGGQTLNLNCLTCGHGYYGMCQWSLKYSSKVFGRGINGQCDYLMGTIKREFDVYGGNYASGFNYNSFVKMKNEQNAAVAFAAAYERCGSASYSQRAANATKAYNYFVD